MLFFWRKVRTYWKGESVMKKLDTKKLGMDILIDIIGGILIAIGTYNFAAMAKFPMVGFNGIALIFYHLFGLPIGTVAMLLNIPVAMRVGVTPVPIPNTMVKTDAADNTWLETAREDRWLPDL